MYKPGLLIAYLLILLCTAFGSATHAQFLLFTGETARTNLSVSIHTTPGAHVISSRELRNGITGYNIFEEDLIVVDLNQMQFRLYRDTTPYQYMLSAPELTPFRLDQQVAVKPADSLTFLSNQNITAVNSAGAFVYVGQFNSVALSPLSFVPAAPPDFDEDGLPNSVEDTLGLNAAVADSDGDGLSDLNEDSDGDGASNIDEINANTDPANPLDKPPVNECAIDSHNCHANAFCSDTPESFTCDCSPGFLGDGTNCVADDGTDVMYRASLNANGAENLADSDSASISVDGAFTAYQNTDASGTRNCMVHTPNGDQLKVNQSDPSLVGGGIHDGSCSNPAISRYGKYVAFESSATNLTPEDALTSDTDRIFLRQMGSASSGSPAQPAHTILVSRNNNANEGAFSEHPAISDNGRFVIYDSNASELTANDDTNGLRDVFIYDRETANTELVSVQTGYYSNGQQVQGQPDQGSYTFGASVTDDGGTVAFMSDADGLTGGDGHFHIIIRNRLTDTTKTITAGANSSSYQPRLSADGRWVAFESEASNLVPNDNNGQSDIFLYDSNSETTTLISTDSTNTPLAGHSLAPDINSDGRFVVFQTDDFDNETSTIWRKDVNTGLLKLVSRSAKNHDDIATIDGNGAESRGPSLSGNGNIVAFSSNANNMLPDTQQDLNQAFDIYVHRSQNLNTLTLQTNRWYLIALPVANTTITTTPANLFGDDLGTYGQTWVMWGFDTSLAAPDYFAISADTPLSGSGKAYWLLHLNNEDRTLTIDRTQIATGFTDGKQPAGCTMPNTYESRFSPNCTASPMNDSWTDNFASSAIVAWDIIGPNSTYYNTKEDMVFTTSGNNGGLCDGGCNVNDAVAQNIVFDVFWRYSNHDFTYELVGGNDYLSPWQGLWLPMNTAGGSNNQRSLVLPLAPLD